MTQDTYIPGSEWLYIKIYTGTVSADKAVLPEIIKPLTTELTKEGLITGYFFIRYADPDFHIRLRLKLSSKNSFNGVFGKMETYFKPYCENGLIHKICVDTYKREIERYGEETIDLSEMLFCADSSGILDLITVLRDTGTTEDQYRWLIAMVLIDDLLNCFEYDAGMKSEIISGISNSFCTEFGINSPDLFKPLNNKYRENKGAINEVMQRKGILYEQFSGILQDRLEAIKPIALAIKEKTTPRDLLSSYLHMSMNRLFRNHNRKCEMVVYYLLDKYYLALKHQQPNRV